jgi:hypothetical protein
MAVSNGLYIPPAFKHDIILATATLVNFSKVRLKCGISSIDCESCSRFQRAVTSLTDQDLEFNLVSDNMHES